MHCLSHAPVMAAFMALCSCAANPEPDAYSGADCTLVAVGHTVRIDVWRNPELDVAVPVRADGTIPVPLLDDIAVAGSNTCEVEARLRRAFSEYIVSPDVTVRVVRDPLFPDADSL